MATQAMSDERWERLRQGASFRYDHTQAWSLQDREEIAAEMDRLRAENAALKAEAALIHQRGCEAIAEAMKYVEPPTPDQPKEGE